MKNCELCNEPGATFPSVMGPGHFLCDDAIACLARFEDIVSAEGYPYDEEVDLDTD